MHRQAAHWGQTTNVNVQIYNLEGDSRQTWQIQLLHLVAFPPKYKNNCTVCFSFAFWFLFMKQTHKSRNGSNINLDATNRWQMDRQQRTRPEQWAGQSLWKAQKLVISDTSESREVIEVCVCWGSSTAKYSTSLKLAEAQRFIPRRGGKQWFSRCTAREVLQ